MPLVAPPLMPRASSPCFRALLAIFLGLLFSMPLCVNLRAEPASAPTSAQDSPKILESIFDQSSDQSSTEKPTPSSALDSVSNGSPSATSSASAKPSGLTPRDVGDVAQFLPAATLAYTAILRDFTGFKQQAIGWAAVVVSTYAIKYSLHYLAPHSATASAISKRPDNDGKFEGFPSGHTSSAFAAAGFMQKRYGVRLGLPTALVASFVGFSRIHADRHTALQVICGGLLGFFVSFFCARGREPKPYVASPASRQSMTTKSLLLELGLLSLLFI